MTAKKTPQIFTWLFRKLLNDNGPYWLTKPLSPQQRFTSAANEIMLPRGRKWPHISKLQDVEECIRTVYDAWVRKEHIPAGGYETLIRDDLAILLVIVSGQDGRSVSVRNTLLRGGGEMQTSYRTLAMMTLGGRMELAISKAYTHLSASELQLRKGLLPLEASSMRSDDQQ